MIVGLVTKKLGMTSVYDVNRIRSAVTVLQVLPCTVVAHKTKADHGYSALILGYGIPKKNALTKPELCVFTKKGLVPNKALKEFRTREKTGLHTGDVISLDVSGIQLNQLVDVCGMSIGKGFSGVMKRHNFGGLEASHGVSASHRSGGSTGGCQDPGKVFKNKKMPGHQGAVRVTTQNLRVLSIDVEKSVILICGAVPGAKNSIVTVSDSIKQQSQQW